MKYIISVFSVLFLSINIAISGGGSKTSAYEFLRNESSSRAAGLGGSFVCFADDPNIIFYNPAGIATINNKTASFGFLKHLMDVNGGYASYAQQLDLLDGWIGVGLQYINYGEFDALDDVGEKTGTFGAGDFAMSFGYARKTDNNISYGANIKVIYSSIADNSSVALAGDVGLFYTMPEQMVNMGVSVLNIGSQVQSYAGYNENLPLDIKIGVSKKLEHLPLNINLNFHHLNFSYDNFIDRLKAFSIGGEFTLSQYVQLRLGYNNERRQDLELGSSAGLAGFSIGLGALINKYHFDYAFSSYGNVGALHRINVSTSF
jgi:hypothetical protein